MTDQLLTIQDQEEALSRVYAHAVAARAGYSTATPDFDRDSVDLTIRADGDMRPALDLQLKATTTLGEPRDGYVRFALKVKNYRDLIEETQTPRLLMVLDLPRERDDWLTITDEFLVLRRRAYWLSLAGRPETANTDSVTVKIPITNRFDVAGLQNLMDQSREGRIHQNES